MAKHSMMIPKKEADQCLEQIISVLRRWFADATADGRKITAEMSAGERAVSPIGGIYDEHQRTGELTMTIRVDPLPDYILDQRLEAQGVETMGMVVARAKGARS